MTTDTDKLVEMALEFGATRGQLTNTLIVTAPMLKDLLDAHIASLCGDVEPVAWVYWHPSDTTYDGPDTLHKKAVSRFTDDTRKAMMAKGWLFEPLYPASTVAGLKARATDWQRLYDRAINEANGLTNYVEDRPELRSAERRLDVIAADARALKGQP